MKRTGVIFSIVSVYIIAAFAWWTFSHIRNSRTIYEQQREQIETLCYKATVEVNGAVDQGMIRDTNDIKIFFDANFPPLEIIFDETSPLQSFLIRPELGAYQYYESQYRRRIIMYTLEGVVMVLLLFWGIILIYRSFLSRIRLKKQESNFLLSVTHELKTPLASIKLYLETLQKRKVDPQAEQEILRNSLDDVSRLAGLVDNMLLAAQLEHSRYEPELTDLDLSELVTETTAHFAQPRALDSRITTTIEPGIRTRADQNAMTMVINNLLSNAFKYAPAEGKIEVTLKQDQNRISLCVSNEGACIADEDKPYIFDRFYRAGNEEVRKTKGTGLGLFIVKNLLGLHKASIEVKDRKPEGVTFEITLNNDAA